MGERDAHNHSTNNLKRTSLSPPEVKFSGVCLYGKEVVAFPAWILSSVGGSFNLAQLCRSFDALTQYIMMIIPWNTMRSQ